MLAVTARPGQESADLGGVLYAFRRAGASLSLLALTRGEAAGQNSGTARLEAIRPWETQLAASILGLGGVAVANYRDGELHEYPTAELAERIGRAIRDRAADLLLVVAPEAGDRADAAVARAAEAAAAAAGVPAVASTHRGVARRLDARPGRRHGNRPRDPEVRRRRARQSVRGAARADPPPGPARQRRNAALAAAAGPIPAQRDNQALVTACRGARRRAPASAVRRARPGAAGSRARPARAGWRCG